MTQLKEGSQFWRAIRRLLLATLVTIAVHEAWQAVGPDPEIALIIGEPWEDMRARSTASIGPAITGHYWGRSPRSDARMNLIDPQFGFSTPKARFFTITFDDEHVSGVSMSPQVEPLLLDDTVKVLMDLQDQWRASGWTVITPRKPAFADTPEWRKDLREAPNGRTTYWQAGDKLNALLHVSRFADDRHPDQERYLISLDVASPWLVHPALRKKRSVQP